MVIQLGDRVQLVVADRPLVGHVTAVWPHDPSYVEVTIPDLRDATDDGKRRVRRRDVQPVTVRSS